MHKKRHVRMTAVDIEQDRDAIARGDWESLEAVTARLERREQWDKQHPTGEGSTVERKKVLGKSGYQWVDEPCTYQWVRVSNSKNKVLGTFYIRHHEGDISELFIVPARKGMSPNPYDESLMSKVRWRKADYEYVRDWWEAEHRETRPLNTDNLAIASATGLSEAHKVPGQRPTLGVQPTTDLSGDVRFTFRDGRNGFSVRGSLLAPVLLGFRQHYDQHVNLSMVRAGVDALASNKRNGL